MMQPTQIKIISSIFLKHKTTLYQLTPYEALKKQLGAVHTNAYTVSRNQNEAIMRREEIIVVRI
jgi:hypothetical protein